MFVYNEIVEQTAESGRHVDIRWSRATQQWLSASACLCLIAMNRKLPNNYTMPHMWRSSQRASIFRKRFCHSLYWRRDSTSTWWIRGCRERQFSLDCRLRLSCETLSCVCLCTSHNNNNGTRNGKEHEMFCHHNETWKCRKSRLPCKCLVMQLKHWLVSDSHHEIAIWRVDDRAASLSEAPMEWEVVELVLLGLAARLVWWVELSFLGRFLASRVFLVHEVFYETPRNLFNQIMKLLSMSIASVLTFMFSCS